MTLYTATNTVIRWPANSNSCNKTSVTKYCAFTQVSSPDCKSKIIFSQFRVLCFEQGRKQHLCKIFSQEWMHHFSLHHGWINISQYDRDIWNLSGLTHIQSWFHFVHNFLYSSCSFWIFPDVLIPALNHGKQITILRIMVIMWWALWLTHQNDLTCLQKSVVTFPTPYYISHYVTYLQHCISYRNLWLSLHDTQ